MNKKNIKKFLILITLILCTFVVYKIVNTYAVFYSEAEGTIVQKQADWVIKVNNTDISNGTVETFIIDKINYEGSNNVATGKIAPSYYRNF